MPHQIDNRPPPEWGGSERLGTASRFLRDGRLPPGEYSVLVPPGIGIIASLELTGGEPRLFVGPPEVTFEWRIEPTDCIRFELVTTPYAILTTACALEGVATTGFAEAFWRTFFYLLLEVLTESSLVEWRTRLANATSTLLRYLRADEAPMPVIDAMDSSEEHTRNLLDHIDAVLAKLAAEDA